MRLCSLPKEASRRQQDLPLSDINGRYHGWVMDALCSERLRPRTLSSPPHPGCSERIRPWSLVRLQQTMNRYHGWAMDALGSERNDHGRHHGWLFSERIRPCRYHDWATDALFSAALLPSSRISFQTPVSESPLQFLMRIF